MDKGQKRIYLDYGASTPVLPEVFEAMTPYLTSEWGNPISNHAEGLAARTAIECAREIVAKEIGGFADEIIFTSNGTEGNNLAIMGLYNELLDQGVLPEDMHFITSAIEHPSVLDVFKYLEEVRKVRVDYIGVDHDGIFDIAEFKRKVTKNTNLVSVMYVNNEIGTIQPLEEIGKIILALKKEHGTTSSNHFPYFHSDASQAMLFTQINVEKLHVDFLTIDAQKIYGPKGVGALYVRRKTNIAPLIRGGRQERGLRAGTPNVPGIVGMAKAFELMAVSREEETVRLKSLRDYFIAKVLEVIPNAQINGSLEQRLPNNINISFPGYDSVYLSVQLDSSGIACATRSACIQSGSGSYVVRAMGKDDIESTSTLRFTMGRGTTKEELDATISRLTAITSV